MQQNQHDLADADHLRQVLSLLHSRSSPGLVLIQVGNRMLLTRVLIKRFSSDNSFLRCQKNRGKKKPFRNFALSRQEEEEEDCSQDVIQYEIWHLTSNRLIECVSTPLPIWW